VTPQDPAIDEREGRGLLAALLFVQEHCEEGPSKVVPYCMGRFELLLQQAKQECDGLEGLDRRDRLVEWAARLHHRFECIPPFEKGNGRTGRGLTPWMLTY
jgi:Fic family protein